MPKINFAELRRSLQADYAAQGEHLAKRQADKIVAETIADEEFRKWLAAIDAEDAKTLKTIGEFHADTTARRAIQRILRAQFTNIMKEQAA